MDRVEEILKKLDEIGKRLEGIEKIVIRRKSAFTVDEWVELCNLLGIDQNEGS